MTGESTSFCPRKKSRLGDQDVLKAIHKKGKMNRLEMIDEFSKVVRLEPTESDKAKIAAFDSELKAEMERDFSSIVNAKE